VPLPGRAAAADSRTAAAAAAAADETMTTISLWRRPSPDDPLHRRSN